MRKPAARSGLEAPPRHRSPADRLAAPVPDPSRRMHPPPAGSGNAPAAEKIRPLHGRIPRRPGPGYIPPPLPVFVILRRPRRVDGSLHLVDSLASFQMDEAEPASHAWPRGLRRRGSSVIHRLPGASDPPLPGRSDQPALSLCILGQQPRRDVRPGHRTPRPGPIPACGRPGLRGGDPHCRRAAGAVWGKPREGSLPSFQQGDFPASCPHDHRLLRGPGPIRPGRQPCGARVEEETERRHIFFRSSMGDRL